MYNMSMIHTDWWEQMKNTTGFQRVQELNGMPVDASSTNRDPNSVYSWKLHTRIVLYIKKTSRKYHTSLQRASGNGSSRRGRSSRTGYLTWSNDANDTSISLLLYYHLVHHYGRGTHTLYKCRKVHRNPLYTCSDACTCMLSSVDVP